MRYFLFCIFAVIGFPANAQVQVQDSLVLQFTEYLGYVKAYHPIAKQANLVLDAGQANLMKSVVVSIPN